MKASASCPHPGATGAPGGAPGERKLRAVALGATFLLAGTIFCCAWLSGCSSEDPAAKSYVALSPVAVVLPVDKLWDAANYYAILRPGAIVLSAGGTGMMPLYASGTLLVIEPIPYDQLKEGMTALYRDPAGNRLAHFLVGEMADGWTTRGLNEKKEDVEPMTKANYIGVVVMAFAPEQPPFVD